MHVTTQYSRSLGLDTLFFRMRRGASFYNFATQDWQAFENSETQVIMTEYPDPAGSQSIYTCEFNDPPDGYYIGQIVRSSDGESLAAFDRTLPEVGSLTTLQNTMLTEIFRLMGLDPTRALEVTQTLRSAGPEIVQSVVIDEFLKSTTVTRI